MAYKILFTEDALVDLDVLLAYLCADNDAAAVTSSCFRIFRVWVFESPIAAGCGCWFTSLFGFTIAFTKISS